MTNRLSCQQPNFSACIEGFSSLDCHVIVRQSPEVIEMGDSRSAQVDGTTGRAAAFVRLADDHLDAAYRLARAILRDPSEAPG